MRARTRLPGTAHNGTLRCGLNVRLHALEVETDSLFVKVLVVLDGEARVLGDSGYGCPTSGSEGKSPCCSRGSERGRPYRSEERPFPRWTARWPAAQASAGVSPRGGGPGVRVACVRCPRGDPLHATHTVLLERSRVLAVRELGRELVNEPRPCVGQRVDLEDA